MILHFRPIDRWPGELRKPHERKASPFKASYQDTLRLLDDELRHLDARNIVLMLALSDADLRLDGQVRANAKPAHPGCILAFDSKYGALKYATDVYEQATWRNQEGWHANLRAIALSLEDLRAAARRGVTKRGEQYTGESFALVRLYWFYRMVATGGPDGSDLDALVADEAREAAEWYGPILRDRAEALGAGIPMGAAEQIPEFESLEEAAEFMVKHSEMDATPDDLIGEPGLVALAYRRAARVLHPDQGGDDELFTRLGEARRMLDTSRR